MKFLSFIATLCLMVMSTACDKKKAAAEGDYYDPDKSISEQVTESDDRDVKEEYPIYIGEFNMDERPDWLAERELDYSDISGMTKDELRLLRNAIYAAHNRRFKSEELQNYFSLFSWYSPLYDDYEISLNSTEARNVQFILDNE